MCRRLGGIRQFSSSLGDGLETLTLQNGAAVATQAFEGGVASITVSVEGGSRYESSLTNGVYALAQKAAVLDVSDALKGIGFVTGSTTRETTSLTATVLKDKAGEAAAVLAKALSSPPSAASIAAAQESTMSALTSFRFDQAKVVEDMHSCAYLDTRMGAPVEGTAESVGSLSAADVGAAVSKYASVKVAGVGCKASTIAPPFESAPSSTSALVEAKEAPIFTGSDKKTSYEATEIARICLAYEFPNLTTANGTAAKLLPYMLCAPPQSSTSLFEPYNSHAKLTRELVEQNCIISSDSFYIPYSDTALFGLNIVTKDVRVEDACWYSCNNLVRLCYDVTQSELDRAKIAFAATLAKTVADPAALSKMYAADLSLLGRVVSPGEQVKRVQDLELKNIKDTAYEFIHDCDHALAAVGPLHELPDYNWIRTASYNYHY